MWSLKKSGHDRVAIPVGCQVYVVGLLGRSLQRGRILGPHVGIEHQFSGGDLVMGRRSKT